MTDHTTKKIEFNDAIGERYLAYALSTIMSRSLPDVRDGMKPVHRRLLYAMHQLKLEPKLAYKKCARVVGDVIGKYHPHGDVAVYDTLVRLAQNFSLRYPLIDGQGNFGSIDGDNAAAMRYTESRLTDIATYLMQDLDKDTVDFVPTYDSSDQEPALFPAAFPNLLANGSEGIAVGMATSIPPHNLDELCQALLVLIDNKDVELDELLQLVKGPDFPTGGIIVDKQSVIANCYKSGRGSLRVRARWYKEDLGHGQYQIVVTELPYQVQKSKLIENIATLYKDKKLPLISNIRDESSEDIRLIIEPKNRNCQADMVMESLFKMSALESRISVNLNVINSRSVPVVMDLKQMLHEFLEHRNIVILRRSKYLLSKLEHRLEILAGLKIVYLNLDEIIKIIREEEEPKQIMMDRFALNDIQAEAILNTKLRSLRKIEEEAIAAEIAKLEKEKTMLVKIIGQDSTRRNVIKKELLEIQKRFGQESEIGARRTSFEESEDNQNKVDITAFIEREAVTIICSKMGWIRSVRGHQDDLSHIKYKEGDEAHFYLHSHTTDNILLFTKSGRFYTILADNIYKGKGYGEHINIMVDIADHDTLQTIISYKPNQQFIVASTLGKGFVIKSEDVIAQTKSGKQIINIPDNHHALICEANNGDKVATIGTNRKLLIFDLSEMPVMKKGQGVILQRFKDAKLNDLKVFESEEGLTWQINENRNRLEQNIKPWFGKRGGSGKIPPNGFPKNNCF